MRRGSHAGKPAVAVSLALLLGGCAQNVADERATLADLLPPAVQNAPTGATSLELVERAIAEERIDDARRLLDRLRVSEPDSPRQRLAQAELALAAGQIKPAHDRFAFLVDDPTVGARALQGLGIAKLLLGQRAEGRASLERALAIDPSLWRAWNGVGYAHDSEQRFIEAIEAYGKAIVAKPDYAIAYNNRGFSLLMQRQVEEAVSDLNRALSLDPRLVTAKQNLRLAVAWRGDYAAALIGVERKDMGRALNNIGYIALMRGDLAAAEAYLMRAMEVDPSYNETAARNLAYLRSIKGLDPGAPARPRG